MANFVDSTSHQAPYYSVDSRVSVPRAMPPGLAIISWLGVSAVLWGAIFSAVSLLH